MLWGHNETISSNLFTAGGLPPGDTLQEDTGIFNTELSKRFAGGGQAAFSDNWNYSLNSSPEVIAGDNSPADRLRRDSHDFH
jgi:hypothetical protein